MGPVRIWDVVCVITSFNPETCFKATVWKGWVSFGLGSFLPLCDVISILVSLPWMMWKPLFHVWKSVNPGSALKYIIGHWELSLKVSTPFVWKPEEGSPHLTAPVAGEVEGYNRSRGLYRLLARCEILPCEPFFLLVPDRSFIIKRDGMSQLSTRGTEEKPAIGCLLSPFFPLCYFFEEISQPPGISFILRHKGKCPLVWKEHIQSMT